MRPSLGPGTFIKDVTWLEQGQVCVAKSAGFRNVENAKFCAERRFGIMFLSFPSLPRAVRYVLAASSGRTWLVDTIFFLRRGSYKQYVSFTGTSKADFGGGEKLNAVIRLGSYIFFCQCILLWFCHCRVKRV